MLKKSLPIILLALLTCIFFYDILFFKNIYLAGDLHYYFSIRSLISSALKSSCFPLWTPYLTCGFPLMANPEAGSFDPINLLLLYFLKPITAFNLLICVYFFMAGLFTFLFCRSIGLNAFCSLFSAVVFVFGGAFAGRLVHISMIFTASFLPFIFRAINLFFQRRKLKFIFLAGLGIGVSFLPGHPQIAVYVTFASLLYFLFNAFLEAKNNFKFNRIVRYVGLIAVILIIAFGISAIQNLPTKELTGLTGRAGLMTYKGARNTSLNLQHFITYIFPHFFGMENNLQRMAYWGKGGFWELYLYLGILPLCLLFAVFGQLKDKRVLFFLGLSALSLLFALGKNGPLFFILFYLIPPLRYFKDPCRFVFISSFSLAVLGGLGLEFIAASENLLKKMLKRITAVFLIIASILIIFNIIFYLNKDSLGNSNKRVYLAFQGINLSDIYVQLPLMFFLGLIAILWLKKIKRIKKETLYILIIMVTVIDLFIVHYSHNLPEDNSVVSSAPPSVVFLKKDRSLFRVFHIGPDFAYSSQRHAEIDKIPFFVIWGVPSANFAGPLRLTGYNAVFNDINDTGIHKKIDIDNYLDMFGLFNVKYFTSTVKLKHQQAKLVFSDGVINIYENPKVIPRVFFADDELSLRPLKEESQHHKITMRDYRDAQVEVDVDTDRDGFLVMSDTYYPGWKAFVDGKEEEIIKANTIMRAVSVKEGRHKVKFIYEPVSVKIGLLVSIVSFLAVVFVSLSKIGNKAL